MPPPRKRPPATAGARPDHAGHRKRLRQRFLKGGPEALPDYELLELVLYGANPRGDTKPLAKRLLDTFGSFAGTIGAPPERLAAVKGMGDTGVATLKAVQAAAERLLLGEVKGRPVLGSWHKVLDYLRAAMAWRADEALRVLYLNQKNALIADEVQQKGTVNHAPVYPREVAKRALELGATAVILVHNHPSGDPTPSRGDVEITREVRDALKAVGVALHDHVVVGREGHASLRNLGHI